MDWSHAYCDNCEKIQPTRLVVGGEEADEAGQFEVADLFCTGCDYVIACLYRPVKGFSMLRS